MVLVLGGLPEPPFLNIAVYDEEGNFLGIVDMHYDVPLFGLEYDGSQHAEPEHHIADIVRENSLLTLGGMPLLRYTARDVYGAPQRIVAEVGTMLRRAA
jgi:very-short-patch-repair endonuclease